MCLHSRTEVHTNTCTQSVLFIPFSFRNNYTYWKWKPCRKILKGNENGSIKQRKNPNKMFYKYILSRGKLSMTVMGKDLLPCIYFGKIDLYCTLVSDILSPCWSYMLLELSLFLLRFILQRNFSADLSIYKTNCLLLSLNCLSVGNVFLYSVVL